MHSLSEGTMQRVLILSCSTGQGHNSCATAIKETFELQGVPCDIRDALGFISDKIATAVSKGHNFTYRYLPWAFKKGYHYSEIHPSVFDENSYSYRFLTIGTEPLVYDRTLPGRNRHPFGAFPAVCRKRPLAEAGEHLIDIILCSIHLGCGELTAAHRHFPFGRVAAIYHYY